MIADNLAICICNEYVKAGSRVLDPFCGTGRTLVAAAAQGAYTLGVDVNPLALFLTSAKLSSFRKNTFNSLLQEFQSKIGSYKCSAIFDFDAGRKVDWFSDKSTLELSQIVHFINSCKLSANELTLVACILSATARDVSYCRKDQWKIHRMSIADRSCFQSSAIQIFTNRLAYVAHEVEQSPRLNGKYKVILADTVSIEANIHTEDSFDFVFTSPPYGDSRTTVQYGGISTLCLGVLKSLRYLKVPSLDSRSIDGHCLGGMKDRHKRQAIHTNVDIGCYWGGDRDSETAFRVCTFLADLSSSCTGITDLVKRGGHIVFVVGRRTVGKAELQLDHFVTNVMQSLGCSLIMSKSRDLARKVTPCTIHRHGGSKHRPMVEDRVETMRDEHILIFRKV